MTVSLQGSLMVDIAGKWLTAEDRHLLRQPEVAGLIIFARNIEHPRQVRELSASIRAVRPDLLLDWIEPALQSPLMQAVVTANAH